MDPGLAPGVREQQRDGGDQACEPPVHPSSSGVPDRPDHGRGDHRHERRALGGVLVQVEQDRQRRHVHDPAPEAERHRHEPGE